MKDTFTSQFADIKLILTGWDEPNNGRMLHTADLYIQGELRNQEYFGEWNRLDENLSQYEMDSKEGKFVYIPAEGGGFLIDTLTFEKIALPDKGLSTLTFVKNEFTEHHLLLVHTDEVIRFDLVNLQVEKGKRASKT
ncbi:MAG: hypothetical protein ACKVTZ_03735 [Bacteroidia bacterium]